MAERCTTYPVKMCLALLYHDPQVLSSCLARIADEIAPTEHFSHTIPFHHTDYYTPEMGRELQRCFCALQGLYQPAELVSLKHRFTAIEEQFLTTTGRSINLDPGYLDLGKLVLASYKEAPPKLYLDEGVFADMQLYYNHGAFEPLAWAFPDLRSGAFNEYFNKLRIAYRTERRAFLRAHTSGAA